MIGALALLLLAALLLATAMHRPSSNFAVLSGLLVALAAWQRPAVLIAAALLGVTLLDRRYPLRARAHLAASGLLGLSLGLLPWLLCHT